MVTWLVWARALLHRRNLYVPWKLPADMDIEVIKSNLSENMNALITNLDKVSSGHRRG